MISWEYDESLSDVEDARYNIAYLELSLVRAKSTRPREVAILDELLISVRRSLKDMRGVEDRLTDLYANATAPEGEEKE
jgi:hypothetical protein